MPARSKRLLTDRWRDDSAEAAVDPNDDGNMFSFYHLSRLDFHLSDGSQVDCENLRAGCSALSSKDGYRGQYSYIKIDTTRDAG